MARHRSQIAALFWISLGICACNGKPFVPVPGGSPPPGGGGGGNTTAPDSLDFLGAIYPLGLVIAIGDVHSNGSVEPLGTKNDGFGTLVPLQTAGLESLTSPPLAPREQHTGRQNRDTRVADFNNDGFPGVVSNTYDCVDPLNPDDVAKLYKNNGDGTFTEVLNPFRDSTGQPLTIQGRGETIVVADFNNDGFLDIFIPYYSYDSTDQDPDGPVGTICENSKQSYLLINDGTGHFTDVADAAGVSLRNLAVTVEGAQALDFNNDGLIDLLAGNHLFINTGITNNIPHFKDMGPALGLPSVFVEEGAKFVDAYNDGFLDLVLEDPNKGPALFKFDGQHFTNQPTAFPAETYGASYGVNAYDISNDGLDDVIVTGGAACDPKILLNTGSGFKRVSPQSRPFTLDKSGDPLHGFCLADGAMAFGDLNNDGKIDILTSTFSQAYTFTNNTDVRNPTFVVEVLGPDGEQNQQGRVVRMSPESRPGVIFTRVVDGGSGYLSQNQYPILMASPYVEQHVVTISLPQIFSSNKLTTIKFPISPGQRARVFAPSVNNPNGRVEIVAVRGFIFDPALYPAAQGIME